MNNKEKNEISFRLATGALCGLTFLEDYLYGNEVPDLAFIRSIYMLLSYNVELLLKSRVVMLEAFSNEDELRKKLIYLSHDLTKIGGELGSDELVKIGIKKIIKKDTRYIIKTIKDTEVEVEDFIDIRYDFIFGKRRLVPQDEHKKLVGYIEVLLGVLKSINIQNKNALGAVK